MASWHVTAGSRPLHSLSSQVVVTGTASVCICVFFMILPTSRSVVAVAVAGGGDEYFSMVGERLPLPLPSFLLPLISARSERTGGSLAMLLVIYILHITD